MSVHLTIGLSVPTVADALARLVADTAHAEPGFSGPTRGAQGLRTDLLDSLASLTEMVERMSDIEVWDEIRSPALIGRSLPVPLEVAAHLPHLDGGSRLRLTPFGVVRIRRISEETAEVAVGDRRLRVPWAAATRLLHIDPGGFCLGEVFEGNAPQAARTLSRLLVAEGVAEPIIGEFE